MQEIAGKDARDCWKGCKRLLERVHEIAGKDARNFRKICEKKTYAKNAKKFSKMVQEL